MATTPIERYREGLASATILQDKAQEQTVALLQALYESLLERVNTAGKPELIQFFARLWGRQNSAEPVKGLYLWGGVGRGKTYLMDIFYDTLPFPNKMRTHFHRFMRRVHQELTQLTDQPNPLEIVAIKLAREAKVICFDEFFVSDITDAMILANLLDALFARGVTLVATSNIEPDGLYKDGLQRARFLPAIDLLKTHTQVVNVDGEVDYRLRALKQAPLYYSPVDEHAHASMRRCFEQLVPNQEAIVSDIYLDIEGRKIPAIKEAEDVVWFDFKALCDGPRSQNDYIEIAREYHTVLVENVPAFNAKNDDQARRFIFLVDEFYDRNVKLFLSAAKPVAELYAGERLVFEFQRTISRLREMQSTEYLARGHKA